MISVTLLPLNQGDGLQGGEETKEFNDTGERELPGLNDC